MTETVRPDLGLCVSLSCKVTPNHKDNDEQQEQHKKRRQQEHTNGSIVCLHTTFNCAWRTHITNSHHKERRNCVDTSQTHITKNAGTAYTQFEFWMPRDERRHTKVHVLGEAAMGGDGQSSDNVRSCQLHILLLKRPQKNPKITHTQRTNIKDKQRNRQIRERNMRLSGTHKIGDKDTGHLKTKQRQHTNETERKKKTTKERGARTRRRDEENRGKSRWKLRSRDRKEEERERKERISSESRPLASPRR